MSRYNRALDMINNIMINNPNNLDFCPDIHFLPWIIAITAPRNNNAGGSKKKLKYAVTPMISNRFDL